MHLENQMVLSKTYFQRWSWRWSKIECMQRKALGLPDELFRRYCKSCRNRDDNIWCSFYRQMTLFRRKSWISSRHLKHLDRNNCKTKLNRICTIPWVNENTLTTNFFSWRNIYWKIYLSWSACKLCFKCCNRKQSYYGDNRICKLVSLKKMHYNPAASTQKGELSAKI
jgi:hypothetical protein